MKKFGNFAITKVKQKDGYERIYCDTYSQPYEERQDYEDSWQDFIRQKYKVPISVYKGNVELYLKDSRDKFSLAAKKVEKSEKELETTLLAAQKEYEEIIAPFLKEYHKKRASIYEEFKERVLARETLEKECPHKDRLVASTYDPGEFVSSSGRTYYKEYCLFCKKNILEYTE